MKRLILPSLVLIAGCAEPAPRVYHYSWGNIVVATHNQIDTFCKTGNTRWDNGSMIMRGQHFAGCFERKTGDVWVRNDCIGAEAIVHELAHKDGVTDPEESGYDW